MLIALVYQAGIANVFTVVKLSGNPEGRGAIRVRQGSFNDCEQFCIGARYAGATVKTFSVNVAGDVQNVWWNIGTIDAPFRDKMNPVNS